MTFPQPEKEAIVPFSIISQHSFDNNDLPWALETLPTQATIYSQVSTIKYLLWARQWARFGMEETDMFCAFTELTISREDRKLSKQLHRQGKPRVL